MSEFDTSRPSPMSPNRRLVSPFDAPGRKLLVGEVGRRSTPSQFAASFLDEKCEKYGNQHPKGKHDRRRKGKRRSKALGCGTGIATVHEYVTSLYRHFGVNSRAELLSRWTRRGFDLDAPNDY
jgi:hypothetical protein